MTHIERELQSPASLCLSDGSLNPQAIGWSRHPLISGDIPGHWPRKKRWEYWCITGPSHALSVTVADLDYLGLVVLSLLDLRSGELIERAALLPPGKAVPSLPFLWPARLVFRGQGIDLLIEHSPEQTRIQGRGKSWSGRRIEADLTIALPAGHETLNVLVPWGPRQFQLNAKHAARPASGEVRLDGRPLEFDGAFGCLDWGRGVWPHRTAWNWAHAVGRVGERVVGINLGGRWTDGTGSTENGLTIDGRIHKISEDLVWTYDPSSPRKPWRIHAPRTRRVDVTLTPRFPLRRGAIVGPLGSRLVMVWGDVSGEIVSDEGETIRVENLPGWAEDHQARW